MPFEARKSRLGVFIVSLPLKPVSPQPKSSHISKMTFGRSGAVSDEQANKKNNPTNRSVHFMAKNLRHGKYQYTEENSFCLNLVCEKIRCSKYFLAISR